MKSNLRWFYIFMGFLLLFGSCRKDGGAYKRSNANDHPFEGNVYEYLKSKPGLFDSLLYVIDRLGLADTLKKEDITLFAPTNESFVQVVNKKNLGRTLKGKPRVYLKDVDPSFLDSLICRYIIRGSYSADSLTLTDGVMLYGVRYNYPMNAKLHTASASGYIGGGPGTIYFYYTNRSVFTTDWIMSTADAINIKTTNGYVHILEDIHPFGFGIYTKPVPEPFDRSIFKQNDSAFVLPVNLGETTILEAEDYDLGGEGVAYHDNDSKNSGRNYRPTEWVDVDVPAAGGTDSAGVYPESYSLGWSAAGEWVIYSINAPIEGDYQIISRVGNGSGTNPLKFHIEMDNDNISGSLTFPNNKGWHTWLLVPTPVFHLKAGIHYMKFFWETPDVQVNNYTFTRLK